MAERKKSMRTIQGRVVSDKMNKTRVVLVETLVLHPVFKKAVRRSNRIKVHDEKNESRTGDVVVARETRPLSKDKFHKLLQIVQRSEV